MLTYESTHCSEDLLGIDDVAQRARIGIGGKGAHSGDHSDDIRGPLSPRIEVYAGGGSAAAGGDDSDTKGTNDIASAEAGSTSC